MDPLERCCNQLVFTLFALFVKVPGSNACYRRIFLAFSILILSCSTVFQGLLFVTEELTIGLFVEILPTIVAIFGCLLYTIYITVATRAQYQRILTIIRNDFDEERTDEENAIKRQFATNAKTVTNVYLGCFLIAVIGISLTGFISTVLDIFIPLNQSREREFIFNGEIFIDQQKYFYHIYFVECCTAFVVSILVSVGESMGVIIVQYICGMSAVLGHRLKNLTETQGHEILGDIDYEQLITRRLQKCIKKHQKVLESVAPCKWYINSTLEYLLMSLYFPFHNRLADIAAEFHDIPLALILTGSFCTLTMSLVQVTDPHLMNPKMIIYTIGQFCQLFLVSFMGQRGIDASFRISEDAYFAQWNNCPAKVRKMLQLVILRSSKPCKVIVRGIYDLSIENFMSAVQAITSIFMVFRHAG